MDDKPGTQVIASSRQCDICQKTFVRAEHLERHKRIHTKEKPFPCPLCSRSFQRSDVRSLHVKKSHGLVDTQHSPKMIEPKRKRVKVACETCRRRKMRCDGGQPCSHCRAGSISICQYNPTANSIQHADDDVGQDVMEASSGQEIFSDLVEETHYHGVSQQPTPVTTPTISTGTFTDAILPQCSLAKPFATAFDSEWDGTVNQASLTDTGSFAPLDAEFSMDNDLSNVMMTDLWQVPLLNGEAWWNDVDLDDDDLIQLHPDHTPTSSSVQKYSLYMQEYFNRKSSAPSPAPPPNKAATMWYSAPASLADHDLQVVNVFLHIFNRHVPKYLKLFHCSEFTSRTRPELILAAAAVGGLYCSVEGSFEFSKAMYNDSRRLLLAYAKSAEFYNRTDLTCAEMLVVVKTFILHETYGLCSGDKRSYEFVEVFREDLVKALKVLIDLYMSPNSTVRETEMVHLLEALHILDCYRVVLLQRPPSLLSQLFDILTTSAQGDKSSLGHLGRQIRGLTNPSLSVDSSIIQGFSLATLAALAPFLWHTMPLAPADQDAVSTPWKTDFVELATEKWLRSQNSNLEPASLILYHLMNITMHANLPFIQNYAHSSEVNNSTRGTTKSSYQNFLSLWIGGRHHEIAKWHAEQLLACAEQAISSGVREDATSARHGRGSKRLISPEDSSQSAIDAAHVPYSVYYATLVLWCGAVAIDGSNVITRQSYVARGRHILAQQRLQIAPLLGRVLSGLRK